MKTTRGIGLKEVQAVYGGAEGDLWELVMGEQIHIGGFKSSMALARRAGIRKGMSGVDLCCCTGAGMRFLARMMEVASMRGVDATPAVVERGRQRCRQEGFEGRISFTLAEATDSGLPSASADFVWGEDAWCYVENKPRLIAEAARIVKPGGIVAFTDWVEGPAGLTTGEAERYLRFMKFPNVQDIAGYCALLKDHRCAVRAAEDTGMFAKHVDLYLQMLDLQLTYDALKIIGFDMNLMGMMAREMAFMQGLAHAGKIAQALFVAIRE
jgi:ubiquinone/menaquinone biosynthesis C-methylase UbiE